MKAEQPAAWAKAVEAARSHAAPEVWRIQLADALYQAVAPDIVAVFTCPLGNPFLGRHATFPQASAALAEAVVSRLADLYQTGGQHFYLEKQSSIFATTAEADGNAATLALHRESLATAGVLGTVVAFFRTRDGLLAGWAQLFTATDPTARCTALYEELERVRVTAEKTLRISLEMATEVGASIPARSLEVLTWREREVALLVGAGLTDLNIARRLEISEGTVGRHLQSIFRKLEVHSRLELFTNLAKSTAS